MSAILYRLAALQVEHCFLLAASACIRKLSCCLQVLTFAGAIVNVMRIPEKWYHSTDPRVPGKFDYWLNSHNLMHILVAGAMTHYSIGAACDYLHFLQQTQCPAWEIIA